MNERTNEQTNERMNNEVSKEQLCTADAWAGQCARHV